MAPEVMKGQNHSYTVDYFALGIMGYEFMLGRRPYNGRSRREIKEQMLSKNVQISFSEIPNGWSEEAADFFNKLLQRKPDIRLGSKGIWELKQHRWLKYFPWEKLINKELESPFIPEKKDNFDKKYCEANDSINIETKVRYEKYRSDIEYDNYFINFTFYRIISEIDEEKIEKNSLNTSLKKSKTFNEIKPINNKENKNKENKKIEDEEEIVSNSNINELDADIRKSKTKKSFNNIRNEELKIQRFKNNNPNKKLIQEKITNIPLKEPNKKEFSFTIKLNENQLKENNKLNKEKIKNMDFIKNGETRKQSYLLRNDNILEVLSDNMQRFKNKDNSKINKLNKNSRSKTPIYLKNRKLLLEGNNKNLSPNNSKRNSQLNREKLLNKRLIMSQNHFDNYRENIRNLLSKQAKQKMNICSPGYYSKHSLQINNNLNKFNNNLNLKRNSSISDFNKTPAGSINSITKSPKITTSTSTSLKGYKKRTKSVTPLNKNKKFLIQNYSVKNFINKQNGKSRVNLSNIYNQNFSYVKRIKEMNSFNYNNKIMNNISNIKNKNNKRTNEMISSYSISSSSILKQIRNTNYNKNKVNIINKNNPLFLYNNVNHNQRMKQNNKISLELELNADSQTFSRYNKDNNNNKNDNKSKKRKSNIPIKNNILNKNHSTINISSMKMAMNGNININVVIKGNNNTTNLINKYEVNKKNRENVLKNCNLNNKKFQRSHSVGFFKVKLQ